MLLLGLFPMSASCQSAQPSAAKLLIGTWESFGVAFSELAINVQPGFLDMGDCSHIRYAVIRDQPGYGHGPENRRSGHVWRSVAIQLVPGNAEQAQCLQWTVLEFSILLDKQVSADVALFKTRAEFGKSSDYFGWGNWIKVK